MISGTEPHRNASTGVPQAIASIIDNPRGQAAVPSTVVVWLGYVSMSLHVDHRDHLPFSEKPTSEKPDGFSEMTATVRPNVARPPSHGTNIVGFEAQSIAPGSCGIRFWLATLSEGLETRGSIAQLGAWGLFWCQLKHIGHSAEFGKRTGLHLPHQVSAMHFHRGFRRCRYYRQSVC
jgi:hypothetical protein